MSTPVSTVDAARTALYTLINGETAVSLQPALTIAKPGVYLGLPAGQNLPDDIIAIGSRVQQRSEPHNLVGGGGSYWLLEQYTIDVMVSCYRGGDDQSQAWSRMVALVAAVDDAIRQDPSLGNVIGVSWPAGHDYNLAYVEDHKGWLADCEISVMVKSLP